MSQREDQILERLLQRLENPDLEDPGMDLSAEEHKIWREYSELVGLLPYALDPVDPNPSIREAVLSAAHEAARESEPEKVDNTVAFPGAHVPSPYTARSLQLVAAAVGVLALGLALLSGWMFRSSQIQEARLAELGQAFEESLARERDLTDLDTQFADFRRVMTAPGMRVCPLKPRGQAPAQPVARGAIYFDVQDANWFLTARNLAPCDKGSRYKVWFIIDDGSAVSAANLDVGAEAPVTFGSGSMPEGMKGVLLTLERDPSVDEPTGPVILYGDESMEML